MSMEYPATVERVEKEIEYYTRRKRSYKDAFALYREVYAVQMEYLPRVDFTLDLAPEEIKSRLEQGCFLLSNTALEIDRSLFVEILRSVCQAVRRRAPRPPEGLESLPDIEAFQGENLAAFLKEVQLVDKVEMEKLITGKGIDEETGIDREVISYVIFMSLKPFYLSCMQQAREKTDFAVWREGYCPICGQRPMMAKLREDDGARVLECWLCHAQWVFPRLECPFCKNSDQKKLQFFYVKGDAGHRVHVCEKCKRYIKTTNAKELEKDVILDIENIITMRLDLLARREGYKPAVEKIAIN